MAELRHITLMTDFGHQDIYVGVMKGVIASLAPSVRMTDLCHEIRRHGLVIGGVQLAAAVPYFPSDTLHVVVIDPGVGSERRVIYAETERGHFLAPDNGVLTPVFDRFPPKQAFSVENSKLFLDDPSRTFHGRDIFAPVAAQCALGLSPEALGPRIESWERLPMNKASLGEDGRIRGEVLFADVFGNLCTNVPASMLGQVLLLSAPERDREIPGPLAQSYAERPAGEPLLIINSFGFLELACNQGSAAKALGLCSGDSILVKLEGQGQP